MWRAAALKHVEDAVEIGGEHAAPLFFAAVDEGVPSAAADAGIGEAAVDPAERLEGGRHRRFDRGGIADVADAGIDLAGVAGHGRGGVFCFCLRCGPRLRRCTRLRPAPARCQGRCRHCPR